MLKFRHAGESALFGALFIQKILCLNSFSRFKIVIFALQLIMLPMFRRRLPMSSLDRLEREANNELRLLLDIGPEYFGVDHLLELREKAKLRIHIFTRRQRLALTLGGTATGWVFLGILFWMVHAPLFAVAAYIIAAVSFGVFLTMVVLQKWHFESRGELEHALQTIEEELLKRSPKKTA